MAKLRVLCVLTNLLGNKATTKYIADTLDGMSGIKATYLVIETADYQRFKTPRWANLTEAWKIRSIARQKMATLEDADFDIALFHSWEFVCEFSDLAERLPAAVLMDAVPSTFEDQLRRQGRSGWKRQAATLVHDFHFRRAAKHFKYFLPMGSDCATALSVRYNVPSENCFVTLAPKDLDFWRPAAKAASDSFRLIFVTNDFIRKGGDFLMRLFVERLATWCTLTIVSNDSTLQGRVLPAGVVWRRGLNPEQIRHAYQQSDLFLFPTLQDFMPQVLAEALCTGLPCISNDVGGIRDLVRDGETGFLMNVADPTDRWAERISSLHSNPAELARLSSAARLFAEKNLGLPRFRNLMEMVVQRLSSR